MDVLVLSSSYEPLSRVSWQKAISWWVQGRVEVVQTYHDRVIRTVSEVLEMPLVVRFLGRVVKRWLTRGVKFNRTNVYARDNGLCQYCGVKVPFSSFTYDHVHPRSQGGKTDWDNIVVSCRPCNRRKADRTPAEAKMKLLKPPAQPRSLTGAVQDRDLVWKPGMPSEWKTWSLPEMA